MTTTVRRGGSWMRTATVLATVVLGMSPACGSKSTTAQPGSGGAAVDAGSDLSGGGGAGGSATGGLVGSGGGGRAGQGAGGMGTGGAIGKGGAGGTRACPGYVAPMGPPCRSSAECGGSICTATPSPPGCGFQSQPMRLCQSDADCTNGFCQPAKTKAPCATGPDIVCVPRCTATSCAANERCRSDGHCEIFPCSEGFSCPDGRTCAPSRAGADVNGCAASSCMTDGWTCATAHMHCEPTAKNGADLHGCAFDTCDTGAYTCDANRACGAPGDVYNCHCVSDAACPTNARCDATRGLCQPKTCAADGDCDCGVCINKSCQPGLWACQLQAA